MMSLTVITLAVAGTLVTERKISANDSWNTRLSLHAQAGLANAIAHLNRALQVLDWSATDDHLQIHRLTLESGQPDIQTQAVLSHPPESDTYIAIQSTSSRNDGSGIQAQASQYVRPLSVLTPLAESAPPLVINGCPIAIPANAHIRPRDADAAQAADAVWLAGGTTCTTLGSIDTHGGTLTGKPFGDELWPRVFSLDQAQFEELAAQQQALPEHQRQYWNVQPADLAAGRWNRSLGNTAAPVALYFPASTGCPEFSAGVRIVGVVFIDSDCPEPIAGHGLGFEVFGSLIVNGNLNIRNADLQLNHIQIADHRRRRLNFPVLRSVAVPGSWRDF